MILNRERVIERLKKGDELREFGNTMMFKNSDYCTAATDIYLREHGLVTVTGVVGRLAYRWKPLAEKTEVRE